MHQMLLSYTLFPYTTLFRSDVTGIIGFQDQRIPIPFAIFGYEGIYFCEQLFGHLIVFLLRFLLDAFLIINELLPLNRKSTRLNSSHVKISYAVFCLKKKIK